MGPLDSCSLQPLTGLPRKPDSSTLQGLDTVAAHPIHLACLGTASGLRRVFTFLKECGNKKEEKKRICRRDPMWLAKPANLLSGPL